LQDDSAVGRAVALKRGSGSRRLMANSHPRDNCIGAVQQCADGRRFVTRRAGSAGGDARRPPRRSSGAVANYRQRPLRARLIDVASVTASPERPVLPRRAAGFPHAFLAKTSCAPCPSASCRRPASSSPARRRCAAWLSLAGALASALGRRPWRRGGGLREGAADQQQGGKGGDGRERGNLHHGWTSREGSGTVARRC